MPTFGRHLTNVKNCDIHLSDPVLAIFHKHKSILSHAVKLPNIELEKELCLAVGASSIGVGSRK